MLNPFEYHPAGNFNKFEFFMSRKIFILFQELACVIMEPLGSLQMALSCQINPQEVVVVVVQCEMVKMFVTNLLKAQLDCKY